MATVVKTAHLSLPAQRVWQVVADVANVPELTAMVASSRVEGDTRYCTLVGGGELRETILSIDHTLRRLAYRVHTSPFPIDEHASSIVVDDAGEGATITWTTDLTPDSAQPIFEEAAHAMFADMIQRMEART